MSHRKHNNSRKLAGARENFWNAQGYHCNSEIQHVAALTLLSHYPFKGDETVLDVGCGDGKLSAYIADKVKQGYVIGVDQSKSMVDFANSHYSNGDFANLDFILKNAIQIDAVDKFDIVFSSFCIQWIVDVEDFLARIMTCLKPRGRFLAVVPSGIPVELDRSFAKSMQSTKWSPYFESFLKNWVFRDCKTFLEVLSRLRFEVSFCRNIFQVSCFQNVMELKEYINYSFPYPSYIPSNVREKYIEEIVDDYMNSVPLNSSHKILFKFPVVEINAMKPIQ